MRERFEQIYATNEWHFGSGEGSLPKNTRGYRRFLQRFLRDNAIMSVTDYGCGDWQFSRLMNWSGLEYQGYDIVRPVIAENRRRFAAANIHFDDAPDNFDDLAPTDLLIAKDVLQHWSYATIGRFLEVLPRFRFALLTNGVSVLDTPNQDVPDSGFRPLDLRLAPFNLDCERVYSYSRGERRWRGLWWEPRLYRKDVLLVRGGAR
jgi:SAM-dependent methyltransferase